MTFDTNQDGKLAKSEDSKETFTIAGRFEFGASDLFEISKLVLGISCPKHNDFGVNDII